MDKYASEARDRDKANLAAGSLQKDFDRLVAIFDRELEKLPEADSEMRAHISEARAAAERGRSLSRRLVRSLREGDVEA